MVQKLTKSKGEIGSSLTLGDFNTPLSMMGKTTQTKAKQEKAYGIFSRIERILGHISLNNFFQ